MAEPNKCAAPHRISLSLCLSNQLFHSAYSPSLLVPFIVKHQLLNSSKQLKTSTYIARHKDIVKQGELKKKN